MPTKEITATHIFDGGWATAFGPNATGTVIGEDSIVRIPFLVDAEDVLFELDGGPRKAPGASKVNSTVLESGAVIKGLFDYWRQGTGGSPSQRRVAFVNGVLYADSGSSGTFSSIKTGLIVGSVINFALFDDILIIAVDSSDVPMSWDQTTFQNLAGSPPNFSFSVKHKNFHFAAGIDATPSRLHYSVQLDPETWTGGTSGTIDIDPDDGDRITGLISHKNELWVFKGPYKGSIHRITGTSNADWARTTFIEGVGAVGHNTIFRFGDDVGFMWSDGSIRSLSVTAAFGDFREAAISSPIQGWLEEHLNFSRLQHAWAATAGTGRRVFITVPADSDTNNTTVLSIDFRFNPPRWSQLPTYDAGAASLMIDASDNNRQSIYFGGNDGFVRKFGASTRTVEGVGALSYKVTTPFLDYGTPDIMKTIAGVGLGIQPRNDGNLTFKWQRDGFAQQTETIAQGGEAVLGGVTGFTLDTDTLAGDRFLSVWRELAEGGEFRAIQYQLTNSTDNEDVEWHNLSTFLQPGGRNMEN